MNILILQEKQEYTHNNRMKQLVTSIIILCSCIAVQAQDIAAAMDSLLRDNLFASSDVSVAIYDLDEERSIYSHRAGKMCRPASVLKLLTAGVALERLGIGHTINTTLCMEENSLYLRGETDPLFSEADLDAMAASIASGTTIDTLFADCTFTDSIYWGPGWSWDDTPWEYQPYMSPLMLNGGCVDVCVKPSAQGSAPTVTCTPQSAYYTIVNEAVSHDAEKGKLTIMRDWLDNTNIIRIRGNCTVATGERMNLVGSDRHFIATLCEKLAARGIEVRNVARNATPATADTLYVCRRSITDVIKEALEESNNLCAEALVYHLGALYGHRPVSHKDGVNIVKGFVEYTLGVTGEYEIADGSGLSLYTYISADIMMQALRHIHSNKLIYNTIETNLPLSGWTGTLKGRMAGTPAERKIRAKTGTVSGICTLAGYAKARNGHTLAFVIFNQGVMKPKLARRWQNKVCELLCR